MNRIRDSFPPARIIAPGPDLFDRAGWLFRRIHGSGQASADRLGAINDLLIALTAWQIGARIVTGNAEHFGQVARHLRGLVHTRPS